VVCPTYILLGARGGRHLYLCRAIDGILARTASASRTDLSVLWRPSWAIGNRNL
jgi:hypothetical protein